MLDTKIAEVEAYKQAGYYTRGEYELWKVVIGNLNGDLAEGMLPGIRDRKALAENIVTHLRKSFGAQVEVLEQSEAVALEALEHAFDFMEQAFSNGQEMVVFVTELTLGREAVLFLAENPCERYLKYNEQLLIGTKKAALLAEINS